jgi:hypothetical protein
MKTVKFDLKLSFDKDVKPQQLIEIMNNINNAIQIEATIGGGIAPEDSDNHTEEIEISHINVTYPLKKKIYE